MRYHTQTVELLQLSAQKARELGHSYVGSVHLLLVMARESGGMGQVLRQLGVDADLTDAIALRCRNPGSAFATGAKSGSSAGSAPGGSGGQAAEQPFFAAAPFADCNGPSGLLWGGRTFAA